MDNVSGESGESEWRMRGSGAGNLQFSHRSNPLSVLPLENYCM